MIASWFFYRTFVPRSWKEWTRAGVMQAFIVAFYAEMYGLPVTIYALTRLFGLDVSGTFWDGNLWIYLTGTPAAMLVTMIIGYSIAFFGIVLVTAGWREVYRARQEQRLATEGPYAVVRQPQYTGFFLQRTVREAWKTQAGRVAPSSAVQGRSRFGVDGTTGRMNEPQLTINPLQEWRRLETPARTPRSWSVQSRPIC